MTKETLDTTNKLIKPEDIAKSDDEVIKQLSENLKDITPGDIDAVFDEIDEMERIKEEEKEKWEIPQELRDFRKVWGEKIQYVDDDIKKIIEDVVTSIPVRVKIESDGSRLIEFILGGKKYKILDPKLTTHSDEKYKCFNSDRYGSGSESIKDINDGVMLGGIRGDDIDCRKNRELAEYVAQKQQEGLHIASKDEIKELLEKLGEEAGLGIEKNQIAMLMYLTGIDGRYWLDVQEGGRRRLSSNAEGREISLFDDSSDDSFYANLCMIGCE